jgi:membrane protein DedA with SNARE-associated domain
MITSHGPLFAVILALLAAGLGVPLPEDLSLLTAGYLVWSEQTTLTVAIPACVAAILVGDSILFWLGYHFGPAITQHKFLRHRLTPRRLERIDHYFERHGAKTIVIGRFAAGARALFFLAAGTMRMSYWKFLAVDGLAALISGTAWILIGWRFGAQIDWVRRFVHRVEHIAVVVVVACIAAWMVTKLLRRRIAGPPEEAEEV